LRLIMNLTLSNALQRDFPADIQGLPFFSQWRARFLGPDEVLRWSFEDMKGAFYLFALPEAWWPLFAFAYEYDPGQLGLPAGEGGEFRGTHGGD
jgi:hypothetical protein